MASAIFPELRDDGSPWDANDPNFLLAGQAMLFKCALIYIKSDWGEYAPTFGLSTWGSKLYPCIN